VLETFPRLQERIDQMAGNLSGGEQQMLALGMAFIAKPKLLVIDELSLGLAPTIVEQLLGIVRRIQASGTAIVLVEQSINVALTVADRAYFMEKGEVRFEGPTAELLERDDIVRSVFLEGAGSVSAKTETGPQPVATRERFTPPVDAEPILSLAGVTKRFGGITAVDDASFHLHRGEILGLIGPNGAGKTTIFDLISGFLIPEQGSIRLEGEDVTKLGPDKRAWMGLGRSFQDARLAGSLTVAENIAIGLERHLEIRDHLASLLNLPLVVRQEEDVAWTVDDLIELMNLGAFRDKFVRELSTGSRRIVDLAMCVAHDPSVLLLDEPSSGIAQRETEALGPLLTRIQAETGCALLVIEHDMPLITGISDRMIALELGHPIVEGTPAEVIADPRVVSSYLGGDMATINRSGAAPAASTNGNGHGTADGNGRARRREPLRAST
jgi:ABC-type branched-subunit amino acid transport system ATPase component